MPYNFVPRVFTQVLWLTISHQRGQFYPKFQVQEVTPHQSFFARLVRLRNALQLCRWQFSHKETLQQTFFKRSQIFYAYRPFGVFRPPLGDLGATYDDRLRLIGKRVMDFLLALIELFSLGVTAEGMV